MSSNQQSPSTNERQWVSMKEAAKILKVSYYKINQLVMSKDLDSRENIRDKRAKLVNLEQARKVLSIDPPEIQ